MKKLMFALALLSGSLTAPTAMADSISSHLLVGLVPDGTPIEVLQVNVDTVLQATAGGPQTFDVSFQYYESSRLNPSCSICSPDYFGVIPGSFQVLAANGFLGSIWTFGRGIYRDYMPFFNPAGDELDIRTVVPFTDLALDVSLGAALQLYYCYSDACLEAYNAPESARGQPAFGLSTPGTVRVQQVTVPEPAPVLLLVSGLAWLVLVPRRKALR